MNGSIRRRSQNSWELTLDLGRNAKGRRLRKFVNVKGPKTEAQRRLRELVAAADKGMSTDESKVTLAAHLERWLKDYAETNTTARTVQGYTGVIHRYLTPSLGQVQIARLTPHQIQELYGDLLDRGLSARTVLHCHRILKESLSHAVRWRMLLWNPCDSVTPPRPRQKEMVALDAGQVRSFLSSSAASPCAGVFELALLTGMRRSELLGLRWPEVDLEEQRLSVTNGLQRISGIGLIDTSPKTARSRRLLSLSPRTVGALRRTRALQLEQRMAVGPAWEQTDYVFTGPEGRPIDPDAVSKEFARASRAAGLKGVRLHDLRHTHASLMLKQGVHPKVVSERLGHASITITLDTYSHVLPGIQDAAAKAFDEKVFGTDEQAAI